MSRVTSKYQITIPVPVRKSLGIIPGNEIDIIPKGKDYILKVNPIEDLKRTWKGRFKEGKNSNKYISDIRGDIM